MPKQMRFGNSGMEATNETPAAKEVEWPDEINPDEPFAGIKVNMKAVRRANQRDSMLKKSGKKNIDRSRNPSVERF